VNVLFEELADRIGADIAEAVAAEVRTFATGMGERFRAATPFLTGEAKESVVGYVGSPPEGSYTLKGKGRRRGRRRGAGGRGKSNGSSGQDLEAVFAGWHPPMALGVAMTVPYAHKLAVGSSSQQPKGWVGALVLDETAKAQEGG
jgi:hypothetical protein